MSNSLFEDDEYGGFEPNRYRRTKPRRPYMGIGPRKKSNDMRTSQTKMVNPKSIGRCVDNVNGEGKTGGMKVQQYKQSGKKYSGPNYPQKDKTIVTGGIIK